MAQVVLTREFALALAEQLETDANWTVAALAAASLARTLGGRVVYSPFSEATGNGTLVPPLTTAERLTYADWLDDLAGDRRWYPAALSDQEVYRPDVTTASGQSDTNGPKTRVSAA